MRLISKATLLAFCKILPKGEQKSAEGAFKAWAAEADDAEWSNFQEIKKSYNTADWVGDGKVVFDIGGNKYRIVCLVGFKSKRMFVLFVGTHKQYDDVDVKKL
jgi:mRNA interferase HigB